MALVVLVALLFCACKPEPIEPTELVAKDVDGNIYQTVKIGTQIWMNEDLRVSHLPDGSDLQPFAIRMKQPSVTTYGGKVLYNSMAAQFGAGTTSSNVQGVCPDGWHLPSSTEWRQLIDYVSSHPECWDTSGSVSHALASQNWSSSAEATRFNQTGFSALPTGSFISYDRHTEVFEQRWAQRGNAYYWCADHNEYYPRPHADSVSPSPWPIPQWGWFGTDSLEVQSFVFLLNINQELPEISSLPDIHYCAIRCVKN